jgi:sulfonate transport system substrate-binding protein
MLERLAAGLLATLLLIPAAAAQTPEKPAKIVVSYVSSPFNVPSIVMRKRGMLEAALPGIAVESPEITSGAKQFQAIAAGALDISSVLGGTSAILGRANGVELVVIAAYSRSPEAFTIMAMPGGPTRIEDLKGRKIAGPKGTTLHQMLVAALVSKGLSLKDVEHINMDLPVAASTLIGGRVDAATLAGNQTLAVEAAGGKAIASGKGLIEPTSVIAVRKAFLDRYPAVVAQYLEAHRQALAFLKANPEEALRLAAEEQKVSIEDARRMIAWYDFSPRMTDRDVVNLEADQTFMIDNAMLTKRIDIRRELILPSAFELN